MDVLIFAVLYGDMVTVAYSHHINIPILFRPLESDFHAVVLGFTWVYGERGGPVVEHWPPEREGWGSKPTSACCVLNQDILLPESTSNI